MTSLQKGLQEYRDIQKRKNDEEIKLEKIKLKYKDMLELDKTKRSAHQLTRFIRRKLLFHPINLSDDEIMQIPGIYRFRCYVYCNDELDTLNELHEIQKQIIENEHDLSMKNIMKISLEGEYLKKYNTIIKSPLTIKYPIMLDLRIYGEATDMPIQVLDKIIFLDTMTKERIKNKYLLINPNTIMGERFNQLIEWSKEVSKSFTNLLKNQNKELVDIMGVK